MTKASYTEAVLQGMQQYRASFTNGAASLSPDLGCVPLVVQEGILAEHKVLQASVLQQYGHTLSEASAIRRMHTAQLKSKPYLDDSAPIGM